MIVNIRGTNGSGEGTAVTRYTEAVCVEEEFKENGRTWEKRMWRCGEAKEKA